ncbi:MAG: NDP-sugar synthase, partial [Myxococcota bacterium]
AASLEFVRESRLLGTGGGLRHAASTLAPTEPFAVMNADIVFRPDLQGALALHRRLGAIATMIVRPDPAADRFGAVELSRATGRVERLLGDTRPGAVAPLEKFMFTGVHILSPEALADLPSEGCIIQNTYRPWIRRGAVVAGFVDESPWRDLGTLHAYLEANLDFANGTLTWPGISPERGSLGSPTRHAARSVVGDRVAFSEDALISDSVIWPDTPVSGAHKRAILTPRGVVSVD